MNFSWHYIVHFQLYFPVLSLFYFSFSISVLVIDTLFLYFKLKNAFNEIGDRYFRVLNTRFEEAISHVLMMAVEKFSLSIFIKRGHNARMATCVLQLVVHICQSLGILYDVKGSDAFEGLNPAFGIFVSSARGNFGDQDNIERYTRRRKFQSLKGLRLGICGNSMLLRRSKKQQFSRGSISIHWISPMISWEWLF